MVSVPFLGGCACGAIRYECTAPPLYMGNCHCRDCQRETGSAFAPTIGVAATALTITQGEPKYHTVTADSGNPVRRGFCPECGSRLFGDAATWPDFVTINAGSLDDPSWYRPTIDIWTVRAQPWEYMNPAIPKFPHQPTEEEMNKVLSTQQEDISCPAS